MGMPITVEIVDGQHIEEAINDLFIFFRSIDKRFSTYKKTSEISQINAGLAPSKWSRDMKKIFDLSKQTQQQTGGYFNIFHLGKYDPSGLVKGWAINKAAASLRQKDLTNFYIEAGGDIQVNGYNSSHQPWTIGIRNPFDLNEIVKIVQLETQGIATSGSYIRGQHIYNPLKVDDPVDYVKSLTVIGPDVYEADRFATAAFAMGKNGIDFIEGLLGFEGYMIDQYKMATFTSGFERYTKTNA